MSATTTRATGHSTPVRHEGAAQLDWAVVAFFAIAYGLAWGIWFLTMPLAARAGMDTLDFLRAIDDGDFGAVTSDVPNWVLYLMTRVQDFSFTIAGLIMITVTAGADGWRALKARLLRWRIPARWYVFGLLPLLLYGTAAIAVSVANGGRVEITPSTIRAILISPSAGLLVSLFLRGAMGEEIGLRGFALPRLQQRWSASRASLGIGVLWAFWHLPVLIAGDQQPANIAILLVLIVGLSFIFTWLFNGSGGSLIPPLLFHATQNWEDGFETILPAIVDTDWETPAALALLVLAAFSVFAVTKRRGQGQGPSNVPAPPRTESHMSVASADFRVNPSPPSSVCPNT